MARLEKRISDLEKRQETLGGNHPEEVNITFTGSSITSSVV